MHLTFHNLNLGRKGGVKVKLVHHTLSEVYPDFLRFNLGGRFKFYNVKKKELNIDHNMISVRVKITKSPQLCEGCETQCKECRISAQWLALPTLLASDLHYARHQRLTYYIPERLSHTSVYGDIWVVTAHNYCH